MRENLAPGHHNGLEVQNWDLPTLAGAGGIRSTASDMLDYLAANMGLKKTKLYPALSLSHKNSGSETNNPIVGLGWHSQIREGRKIVWHNGRTGGYASFTGFIEGGDLGVVVLSNSTMGVDDIGLHVLDPSSPLDRPIPSIAFKIKGIIQDEGVEAAKKAYRDLKKNNASDYDFRENQLNTLGYTFMEDNRWKEAKAVFELNIEAYPNSSNVYDSYGEALMNNKEKEKAIENYKKSLALNPANSNALAMLKKMGVDTEDMEKEVIIDEATLLSYVGKYELAPDFILSVTKRGKQMSAQATGQGTLEIFPKSQNRFYYKVVEAQLQFNQDEAGQVKSVTLFQGGREIEGKKLPE
ncbi:MAG: serine hydrolase, partial [Bacteroidota bacterium]